MYLKSEFLFILVTEVCTIFKGYSKYMPLLAHYIRIKRCFFFKKRTTSSVPFL